MPHQFQLLIFRGPERDFTFLSRWLGETVDPVPTMCICLRKSHRDAVMGPPSGRTSSIV